MDKLAGLTTFALLMGTGCVLTHSLGDDGGDGAADGGGDGLPGSSGEDSADGLSQSDSGGVPGDTSDSAGDTDPGTTSAAGATDEEGDGSSDGPPVDECVALGETFAIDFPGSTLQQPGQFWNTSAVLTGPCDVVFVDSSPEDPSIKGFALDCQLAGMTDGIGALLAPLQPFIAAGGSLVEEGLTAHLAEDTEVALSLAVSAWGQNPEYWLVLRDADGNVLFDAFEAVHADPGDDDLIGEDVDEVLEGAAWREGAHIADVETDCEVVEVFCGGDHLGLEVTPSGAEPVRIEAGRTAYLDTMDPPQAAFVLEAADYTKSLCFNIPPKILHYTSYWP